VGFQVGDEVVCVRVGDPLAALIGLRQGDVYRVAELRCCPCHGDPHLAIALFPNHYFPVDWFRKVERKFSGMETLRSLLVPTKVRVLVE
jgi:hypothetical protein